MAAVVSTFVSLAARRAADGARARTEAEALAGLAGAAPVPTLLEGLRRILGLDAVVVFHDVKGRWTVDHAVGAPVPDSPEGRRIELDDVHVLVVVGREIESDADNRILDAFAREIASSLALEELEAEASEAGALAAAGDLRTAILSAVSHDLRTPLSGIKASVTSLLQDDVQWTPEETREFLVTIDEESDRLNSLVGNLLDMSRLQTGALDVSLTAVGLDEVIPGALASIGPRAAGVDVDARRDAPARARRPGPARARARERDRERPQPQPERSAGARRRRRGAATPSTSASSIAGRVSRPRTATGSSSRSSASATPAAARGWDSASPWRKGSSRRSEAKWSWRTPRAEG